MDCLYIWLYSLKNIDKSSIVLGGQDNKSKTFVSFLGIKFKRVYNPLDHLILFIIARRKKDNSYLFILRIRRQNKGPTLRIYPKRHLEQFSLKRTIIQGIIDHRFPKSSHWDNILSATSRVLDHSYLKL